MKTVNDIAQILHSSLCDEPTFWAYQRRIVEGIPTRDENPISHFCVYFLPYDIDNKRVFIVHHKKSGLWISPGGHIDKGETLLEALNREISEELGIENSFTDEPSPFLLTITPIENEIQPCKKHFDIWYLIPTNGIDFHIDLSEFHDTKWLTINEARKIVTDRSNLQALDTLEKRATQ